MDKHKKKGGEGEKAIIRVQENEKGLTEHEPRKGATTNRLLPERQGAAEWRPTNDKDKERKQTRRDRDRDRDGWATDNRYRPPPPPPPPHPLHPLLLS